MHGLGDDSCAAATGVAVARHISADYWHLTSNDSNGSVAVMTDKKRQEQRRPSQLLEQ